MLCSPKWPGMRPEALSRQTVSLSSDCVAVRDMTDEKTVHMFDSNTGKALGDGRPFVHKQDVVEIALEQTGPAHERKLAIIDKNRDLHLVSVRRLGSGSVSGKLGAMVQSLRWSSDCSMLAAMQDSRFTLWYYPAIISVDRALLNRSGHFYFETSKCTDWATFICICNVFDCRPAKKALGNLY